MAGVNYAGILTGFTPVSMASVHAEAPARILRKRVCRILIVQQPQRLEIGSTFSTGVHRDKLRNVLSAIGVYAKSTTNFRS